MNGTFRAWLVQALWTIIVGLPCTAWPQSQTIVTIAGTGELGYAGDGGPATSAAIDPYGLAVDREGNLFFADPLNSVVRRIDHATGIITTYVHLGGFPTDVAIGPDEDLYVGNAAQIWRVDHRTQAMQQVVGTVSGASGFSGDGGPASAAQINATAIAFDRLGNLVISDSSNKRIRRVDRRTGIITTVVGDGINGPGPESGPAAAAGFIYLISTAFSRNNEMFFADSGLNTVRELDRQGKTYTTVAGEYPGTAGVPGQPATQVGLRTPLRIATDCAGNLTISDSAGATVLQVDHETGIIETIAGTGTPGFSGDGGLAIQAELEGPTGLTFGRDGALYVADGVRIRKITGLPGHQRWDCRDERRYNLHENDHDGGDED